LAAAVADQVKLLLYAIQSIELIDEAYDAKSVDYNLKDSITKIVAS
jgi:hypothetical protein